MLFTPLPQDTSTIHALKTSKNLVTIIFKKSFKKGTSKVPPEKCTTPNTLNNEEIEEIVMIR